jgi:hypothetical protein
LSHIKKCGGVNKRGWWQIGRTDEGVVWHREAGCELAPTKDKVQEHTAKELDEDDTEEVAAMGKAWREVKEIQ